MQGQRFRHKSTSTKKGPYATKGMQPVMGTFVTIIVVSPDPDQARHSIKLAFHEIDRIHDLMSVHKAGSEVNTLNKNGYCDHLSPDTKYVIQKANDFSELTEGAFDITLLPVLKMWEKHARNHTLPEDAELRKKMELVGYKNTVINGNTIKFSKKDMGITLAGIAKGYAVDRAVEVLRKNHIRHALVNGGGDIRAIGGKTDDLPWKIGLRHPFNKSKIMTSVDIKDKAIATSGPYQRFYNDLIHSNGGRPAQEIASATITTEKAIDADVLATAFFVLGSRKGMELLNGMGKIRASYVDHEGHFINGHKKA
jgi:thiamine biosynthesis lipoprotein